MQVITVRGAPHPSGTGRHFGYKRDTAERRTQTDVRVHLARFSAQALPEAASLRSFEAPIFDQLYDGSCGGHGAAQLDAIAFAAQGKPLAFVPSPSHIYTVTRCIERADIDQPLTDSGVFPSDLVTAHARYGIRTMKNVTTSGRVSDVISVEDGDGIPNLNDEPEEGDLAQGQLRLVVGEYRIDETASDVIALVKQTIAVAKAPVGIGVFVASRTMNYVAGAAPVVAENKGDPNGGGHWISIVGYRPSVVAPGEVDLEICNSWSKTYGDAGHFWARESFIRSASDLYGWTARIA